jgi:hypothetical protein
MAKINSKSGNKKIRWKDPECSRWRLIWRRNQMTSYAHQPPEWGKAEKKKDAAFRSLRVEIGLRLLSLSVSCHVFPQTCTLLNLIPAKFMQLHFVCTISVNFHSFVTCNSLCCVSISFHSFRRFNWFPSCWRKQSKTLLVTRATSLPARVLTVKTIRRSHPLFSGH